MNYVEKSRTVEPHSECILYLYLQDADGVPVPNVKMKIYAGPLPDGLPPYFVDDDPNNPNRRTDANGKFQFIVANAAPANRLDFFVQALGPGDAPQSQPIHFPFPGGQAHWVIVTLAPEGAGPGPGPVPAPDLQIDPRLASDVGVTVQFASPTAAQSYWKLISAQYQDPDQSGGNVNIVCFVQDERGIALAGVSVIQKFPGDHASGATDERGHVDFPMTGASSFAPERGEHGPYSAFVDGAPSDTVVGMGLPLRRHVQYVLTWRRSVAGGTQTPGTVRGRISNASSDAQVILQSGATRLNTPINADGTYSFPNVNVGTYSLALNTGQIIQSQFSVGPGEALNFDYQVLPVLPTTSVVRGRITNASPGSQLTLRSGATTLNSPVGADGTFAFLNVTPGTYSLSLSVVGVINPNLTLTTGQTFNFDYQVTPAPSQKSLTHYLLFGPGTQQGTLTNLIIALDYVIRFAPVAGFSVNEAQNAQHVTIVGDTSAVSDADEQRLRDAGCQVARLTAADSYALERIFQQLLASGSPYTS